MVVEIALEGTGLGQRLDERVQKVHCLLFSWCGNGAHPGATVDAAAGRKILALGIEGRVANGTKSPQLGCRGTKSHADSAQTRDSVGLTPANGTQCAGRLPREALGLPGSDLYAW